MPNKRPLALSLFRGHVDYNSADLLNTVALFNVDMSFAGQYSCRVVTDHNESENTAQMTVIVGECRPLTSHLSPVPQMPVATPTGRPRRTW